MPPRRMPTQDTAAFLILAALAACAGPRPPAAQREAAVCRCTPHKPCWPAEAAWRRFGASLQGKLEQPRSPLDAAERIPPDLSQQSSCVLQVST